MSKIIYTALTVIFFSPCSFAQTKTEKKVKATDIEVGMYEGTKSKEAHNYYAAAVDKEKAGDYKGAAKLYEKSIKEDPKFVEAYDNCAVCYRRLGDFKNAIEYYKKSIELYPQGKMAHQNLGLVYGIQKKYDESIAEYQEVQKIDSMDPEGYYGTIQVYINKGDYKSAVKSATKTMEIYQATNSPYLGEGQYLLGVSYFYDGDKENAKTYLQLAKKSGMKIPDSIKDDLKIK